MQNVIKHKCFLQECDLIITAMAPSAERFRILELVHSWYYTPSAFLIPMPEDNANNVEAVVKPFQFWVR
jgi:ionotropic glutamate receptor